MAAALTELSVRITVPIDILHCHFDFTGARVEREIVKWIRSGRIRCVVMGTPCTPWSRARSTGSDSSSSHLAALKCAHFSRRLPYHCRQHRAHVVIENSRSPGLWTWRPFAHELRLLKATTVDLHMCAYDAAWMKPTRLMGTLPGLESLARRCPGNVKHVVLQGLVTGADGRKRWRTSFASAYPAPFSRALGRLLEATAPRRGLQRPAEATLSRWWELRLARAHGSGEEPASSVAVPALPRRPLLGWESSRCF